MLLDVYVGSPTELGSGKRAWTKNKLEDLRRRSPGDDSPASKAKPGPNANMGNETTKRRLIAFLGGIDMCNGRYDTPRHSLFHTLNTVHSNDFYQGFLSSADIKKGGQHAPVQSEYVHTMFMRYVVRIPFLCCLDSCIHRQKLSCWRPLLDVVCAFNKVSGSEHYSVTSRLSRLSTTFCASSWQAMILPEFWLGCLLFSSSAWLHMVCKQSFHVPRVFAKREHSNISRLTISTGSFDTWTHWTCIVASHQSSGCFLKCVGLMQVQGSLGMTSTAS